ncbi:MAG TPA: glycosyltransferase [Terriglobia bacterium]|nr:glycosyltransferase [Terriglobia bacterium]
MLRGHYKTPDFGEETIGDRPLTIRGGCFLKSRSPDLETLRVRRRALEDEEELRRRTDAPFRFLIVGDGTERPWLEANLSNADFTGVLTGEALAEAYGGMDVFVFPSETETFGNVVLEPPASGVPAIVTSAVLSFIIQHGVSGFAANGPAEFADCVLQLVSSPQLRERMALAARARSEEWSWEAMMDAMYRAYRRAIDLLCSRRGPLRLPAGCPMKRRGVLTLISLAALGISAGLTAVGAGPSESVSPTEELQHALALVHERAPYSTERNYVMSARIRLLIFWKGSDDVGGGYIRTSATSDNRSRTIQVLFGSDPKKAPRSINRWGSAIERVDVSEPESRASTVFGFMKTSKGANAAEMEKELATEKDGGQYFFDAILARVESGRSESRVASFASTVDFDIHDFDKASTEASSRLLALRKEPRSVKLESKTCNETRSFLFAVEELGRRAVDGGKAPLKTCYIYNSRFYTLTVREISRVSEQKIKVNLRNSTKSLEKKYTDLTQVEYQVRNQETEDDTNFTILFGTKGDLRGVPVQIRHQPNWWFQIILDLL